MWERETRKEERNIAIEKQDTCRYKREEGGEIRNKHERRSREKKKRKDERNARRETIDNRREEVERQEERKDERNARSQRDRNRERERKRERKKRSTQKVLERRMNIEKEWEIHGDTYLDHATAVHLADNEDSVALGKGNFVACELVDGAVLDNLRRLA